MIDRGFDLPYEVFAQLFDAGSAMRAFGLLNLDIRHDPDRLVALPLWRQGLFATTITIDGSCWRTSLPDESGEEAVLIPVRDNDGVSDHVTDVIAITRRRRALSHTGETAAVGCFRPSPGWWQPNVRSGELSLFTDGSKWLARYVQNARCMIETHGPSIAIADLIPPVGAFETLILDALRLDWRINSPECPLPSEVTRIVADSPELAAVLQATIAKTMRSVPRVILPRREAA